MVEITGARKEVFARHRLKLMDSGMMSFSLPQFLLLCALIDFSPMLDDGYDAQLSVGMSTIYRRVVSGLWDCLSMSVWVWGAAACGHVVWVCSEKVLASIIMTYFSLILK